MSLKRGNDDEKYHERELELLGVDPEDINEHERQNLKWHKEFASTYGFRVDPGADSDCLPTEQYEGCFGVLDAIERGDLAQLEKIVEQGTPLDFVCTFRDESVSPSGYYSGVVDDDTFRGNPLELAVHNDHVDIVKYLLSRSEFADVGKDPEKWMELIERITEVQDGESQQSRQVFEFMVTDARLDKKLASRICASVVLNDGDALLPIIIASDRYTQDGDDSPLEQAYYRNWWEAMLLLLKSGKVRTDVLYRDRDTRLGTDRQGYDDDSVLNQIAHDVIKFRKDPVDFYALLKILLEHAGKKFGVIEQAVASKGVPPEVIKDHIFPMIPSVDPNIVEIICGDRLPDYTREDYEPRDYRQLVPLIKKFVSKYLRPEHYDFARLDRAMAREQRPDIPPAKKPRVE